MLYTGDLEAICHTAIANQVPSLRNHLPELPHRPIKLTNEKVGRAKRLLFGGQSASPLVTPVSLVFSKARLDQPTLGHLTRSLGIRLHRSLYPGARGSTGTLACGFEAPSPSYLENRVNWFLLTVPMWSQEEQGREEETRKAETIMQETELL